MKQLFLRFWMVESHIRAHIRVSRAIARLPAIGRYLSMALDRLLLLVYGIDLDARSIQIHALSVAHPVGVLLGGNGIVSPGRVAVMAGAKFVGRTPDDPVYLERHREGRVFVLGDNVVVGAGSVVMGPVVICDNVCIGAMSLVNRDITAPGVYVGIPVKKVADHFGDQWVRHLPEAPSV